MHRAKEILQEILILRCQIGDSDALSELIKQYQKPLYYFIKSMLKDFQTTEDIFQQTWLTVIKKICDLKDTQAFTTWLYRIARSHVYKELKRQKKLITLNETLVIPKSNIHDEENFVENTERLHQFLEKLQTEYKEVLILRFFEGMSYEQISKVIDCNLGTVRSRIHYAKKAFKKELEK